jgi:hypothetical protein
VIFSCTKGNIAIALQIVNALKRYSHQNVNAETIGSLIESPFITTTPTSEDTPLLIAIVKRAINTDTAGKVLSGLIELGMDASLQDIHDQTALDYSIALGTDIVTKFISNAHRKVDLSRGGELKSNREREERAIRRVIYFVRRFLLRRFSRG